VNYHTELRKEIMIIFYDTPHMLGKTVSHRSTCSISLEQNAPRSL